MTALCVRGLAGLRPLFWLAAILSVTVITSLARADDLIIVRLDQAKVIKVPERAATIVIGNPLIADLSIQPGGLAVITGKAFGATNFMVLDKSGAVLNEQNIQVQGPTDPTVVVYRGLDRETYSCTPYCSPRATLGDEEKYFTEALNQAAARSNQALSSGMGK